MPAGNLLQGPEGSQVTLTVRPGGAKSGAAAKDFKLTRQPIAFNPVDSALCSSSGEGRARRRELGRSSGLGGWLFLGSRLNAALASGSRGRQSPHRCPHCAGRLAPGSPEGKLGYVRIATFSKQTPEKVRLSVCGA